MAIIFTKEGYGNLKSRLKEAEEKRPHAVTTLTRARAMGDLSENGLYKGARSELNDLDRKIRQLKYLIKEAKVIKKPKQNEYVQIGHKVTLRRIT